MELKISISDETFQKFVSALVNKHEAQDVVIERFMLDYAEGNSSVDNDATKPNGDLDNEIFAVYLELTEELLKKFDAKKIGKLAGIGLRELLEKGVAPAWEIAEFQKASGNTQVNKYRVQYGQHVNTEFALSFPLLITKDRKEFDNPQKFWIAPLKIYGEEYHLCSHWVEGLHREKLEAWIRKRLPPWLADADEQSRNEMIRWIKDQL